MKKKVWIPYVLLIPQILLAALFLSGIMKGLIQSVGWIPSFGLKELTLKYYLDILSNRTTLRSVGYSVYISLMSSVFATVIGILLAYLIVARKKNSGWMMRVVQLPIIVPHVVVALMMVNILSQNGMIARICYQMHWIDDQQQFPMILFDSNGLGIILAYLWKEIPFIIYFVIALMGSISDGLGEAARNLGAGKWTIFLKITLPLCWNTILSGFLIIFVFSFGAYELPFLLGSTTPKALPILAYIEFTKPDLLNRPYAMAVNGIIILVSLVAAVVYYLLLKKNAKNLKGADKS